MHDAQLQRLARLVALNEAQFGAALETKAPLGLDTGPKVVLVNVHAAFLHRRSTQYLKHLRQEGLT